MSSVVEQVDLKKLVKQLYIASNTSFPIVSPVYIYFLGLIAGMNREEAIWTVMWAMPPIGLICAPLVTHLIIRTSVYTAFAVHPGEPAGARLQRLLKIPRQIDMGVIILTALVMCSMTAAVSIRFGKSLWLVPWTGVVMAALTTMLNLFIRPSHERIIRPYALAEFHKNPEAVPQGSGMFWIRQSWYLPYAFGAFVVCTIATVTTVLVRKGYDAYVLMRQEVSGHQTAEQFLMVLDTSVAKLGSDVLLPIVLLGSYLLALAAISAWQLSKYQTEGARSVQKTVEALASGNPKLPEWVSTDEIGDLAATTAKAFGRLKAFSISLGESAHALRRSAEQLGLSTSKQSEALTHQATALQETQVTAQEIKQTSALTAQKAEGILQQTEKADQISRAGEAAIQQSLNGLQEIGEQVKEMAKQIRNLDQRTRQIASITTTVKDLADQSNMLALNAAIEAVRSGEHGKGFGVVAREIRTLADQSIRATNNVRSILQDISTAIRSTVSMTEKNSEKVESSLVQVREFGNNIRELSGIVRENAASVRQITAAVTQQNTGITQIFQAVNDLSRLMDQTMVQLRTSDEALDLVRNVTDKVAAMSGGAQSDLAAAAPVQTDPVQPPLEIT